MNGACSVAYGVQGKAQGGGIAGYSDELQHRHARQRTCCALCHAVHLQGDAYEK